MVNKNVMMERREKYKYIFQNVRRRRDESKRKEEEVKEKESRDRSSLDFVARLDKTNTSSNSSSAMSKRRFNDMSEIEVYDNSGVVCKREVKENVNVNKKYKEDEEKGGRGKFCKETVHRRNNNNNSGFTDFKKCEKISDELAEKVRRSKRSNSSVSREAKRRENSAYFPQNLESATLSLSCQSDVSCKRSRRGQVPQQETELKSDFGARQNSIEMHRSFRNIHFPQTPGNAANLEFMYIAKEDVSFVLGKKGHTKKKLMRVSGASLSLIEEKQRDTGDLKTKLEIRGTQKCRERVKLYINFVIQQRVGSVRLNFDPNDRDDLTLMKVPNVCVGCITGNHGRGLRALEEECGTLMFFVELNMHQGGTEKFAIFGEERSRRAAQLKVMSMVEQKVPGYYSSHDPQNYRSEEEGFDTETMPISDADFSYALGKEAKTRKKIAKASGAIVQYVGRIAYIAGTKPQRQRARQYLIWLCAQRISSVHVDITGRTDCTPLVFSTCSLNRGAIANGNFLRSVENMTNTFIFPDGDISKSCNAKEKILIFGEDEDSRRRAKRILEEKITFRLASMNYNNGLNMSVYKEERHENRGRIRCTEMNEEDERIKERLNLRCYYCNKNDSLCNGLNYCEVCSQMRHGRENSKNAFGSGVDDYESSWIENRYYDTHDVLKRRERTTFLMYDDAKHLRGLRGERRDRRITAIPLMPRGVEIRKYRSSSRRKYCSKENRD